MNNELLREKTQLKKTGLLAGSIVLLFIFLPIALESLIARTGFLNFLSAALAFSGITLPEGVLTELFQLAVIILGFLPSLWLAGSLYRNCGIEKPENESFEPIGAHCGVALTAGVAVMLFCKLLSDLLLDLGLLQMVNGTSVSSQNPWSIALYLLRIALVPAAAEGYLFRHVFLSAFRRWGDGSAIAVSALFSVLAADNLTLSLQNFLLGLILGYLAIRTASAWISFTVHFSLLTIPVLTDLIALLQPPYGKAASYLILAALLILGLLALIKLIHRGERLFFISDKNTHWFSLSFLMRKSFLQIPFLLAVYFWAVNIVRCCRLL